MSLHDFELELVRRRLAATGLSEGRDYTVVDWKNMDDGKLLQALGSDARLWAEAFCQHFPEVAKDQDTIATWFANAIESTREDQPNE